MFYAIFEMRAHQERHLIFKKITSDERCAVCKNCWAQCQFVPEVLNFTRYPERDWNREKMPGYVSHIFWLGIPQGSQKCPNENIRCVSWRENAFFFILVVKMTPYLLKKAAFLALYYWFKKKNVYIASLKSVDDFRPINFENRSKTDQFAVICSWKRL